MTSGDDQALTPAASASIPDTIAGSQADAFEERAWVAASGLPCRFGNYLLLEKIGEGGMGVVYKARQHSPDRLVALKMIRAGQLGSDDEVRRFRQEADQAGSLDHPHIVPVYDCGEVSGQHYFSMKLIEGGALNRCLDRFRADPRAAARLLATVARAVHHAHQRQLLHRDLKPANILLDARGEPNVADFGLAKRLGAKGETVSGAVVGTPEYMPPEQAEGKTGLTTSADVYAVGAVLYELLTGRPPFHGETLLDTLRQVTGSEPAPPRTLNAQVPRDLETVCLKCLHKDPVQRYGSAEALAEELERWLHGEPVRARPVGRLERSLRWIRRNPAVAGLLATVAVLLLGGTAVSTYFAIQAERRAHDAEASYQEARRQEQIARETSAQLEKALARSLLRPDALKDLAGASEHVRLRFVEEALRTPESARQLRQRADPCVRAVVRFDPQQRQRAEDVLLRRLRDPGGDRALREDCIHISLSLDSFSPAFAGVVVRQILELMKGPFYPQRNPAALAEALAALAPYLAPKDAGALLALAVETMARPPDRIDLDWWTRAVAALAPRLGPKEAAAPAALALAALGRETNPYALPSWAGVLASLLGRLDPGEAARIGGAAARLAVRILRASKKASQEGWDGPLAQMMASLVEWLDSREVESAVPVVWEAMIKSSDVVSLQTFARVLRTLGGRPPAKDVALVMHQIVAKQVKTTDSAGLANIAKVITVLAEWLDAEAAGKAAQRVVDKMSSTTNVYELNGLAQSLPALTARLEPKQAATLAGPAARPIVDALRKATDGYLLRNLTPTAVSLLERLEPKEADALAEVAARHTLDVVGKLTDEYTWVPLLQDVAALLRWVKPREAAQIARAALRLDQELLTRAKNVTVVRGLAEAVPLLAERLEAKEAAHEGREAARLILKRMAKSPDLPELARPIAVLARWLDSKEALEAVRWSLDAWSQARFPNQTDDLVWALPALVVDANPTVLVQRGELVAAFAGTACTPAPTLAGFVALVEAARPLPGRFSEQQLLDWIKLPTCSRPARRLLVQQLGHQCRRPFADLWEFVAWARQHRSDLDLTSAPVTLKP